MRFWFEVSVVVLVSIWLFAVVAEWLVLSP